MKFKLEPVKLVSILAGVAGVAATLLSDYSNKKNLEKSVAEEVEKVLNNK